ncbi:hypothetical protein [Amycolatopsis taiwanensis]|uniref:hypothetical protein n=1 Tax=Amycolatopsis taiwanensis TaxID=342230 RepID=UPI0012EC5912|nr:hypothetical protein [Amycolatopsis taiwanensis]
MVETLQELTAMRKLLVEAIITGADALVPQALVEPPQPHRNQTLLRDPQLPPHGNKTRRHLLRNPLGPELFFSLVGVFSAQK